MIDHCSKHHNICRHIGTIAFHSCLSLTVGSTAAVGLAASTRPTSPAPLTSGGGFLISDFDTTSLLLTVVCVSSVSRSAADDVISSTFSAAFCSSQHDGTGSSLVDVFSILAWMGAQDFAKKFNAIHRHRGKGISADVFLNQCQTSFCKAWSSDVGWQLLEPLY